uniref:Uncharacterized protein n=1 Tax=Biomphalaria glabrata TaxID=6526 RepID=A0A2C9KP03_BIOGL
MVTTFRDTRQKLHCQIFQSILSEKTEKTSQEQVHSALKMEDMKQDLSDEFRNVKIERKECSPRSDTPEHSSIGQTFEFITSEKTKISEEPTLSRSIMNDLKQDVTNDLKNVIKIEKNESSSDTETSEYSSTSQSLEIFLADETQIVRFFQHFSDSVASPLDFQIIYIDLL